jgi:hypothetical protein
MSYLVPENKIENFHALVRVLGFHEVRGVTFQVPDAMLIKRSGI